MSIILEQDEIDDLLIKNLNSKSKKNFLNKTNAFTSLRMYKKPKKSKIGAVSNDILIPKPIKATPKENAKKFVAKISKVRQKVNKLISSEENSNRRLIQIKQLKITKGKSINLSQILNEHHNPIQSQKKLMPIKIAKPEANYLQPQINCLSPKEKQKIIISIKSYSQSPYDCLHQCKKVIVSNVKNMRTKKKLQVSPKEVFVDITIQASNTNGNSNDERERNCQYGSTTRSNWNKSFYMGNNLSQFGNGAKFALDNYDRFSDNLLCMRRTIGCFNRFQFQNASCKMKQSDQPLFNAFSEPFNSEKYPVYFLPSQGKELLCESNNS